MIRCFPLRALRRRPRRQTVGNSIENDLEYLAVRPMDASEVDAVEWLKSLCCGVELHEFSFAFEEDARNVEPIRIYG